MKRLLLIAAVLLPAGAAGGTTGQAAEKSEPSVATGTIAGAPYRIEMPADWNGELVMLFHGYELKGLPREDPWPRMPGHGIEVFLGRGYAVAVSGYSAQGWAVEEAMADSERLRGHFVEEFGKPKRTYAVGYSMGGHLTLAALEKRPEDFDGGLSLCGANMHATKVFDLAVDALASFDALFPDVLQLGPGGLSDPSSPAELNGEAIDAALRSDPAKAQRLAHHVGIDAGDLPGTLWLYYAVLREMTERAGGFPGDNSAVDYSDIGSDVKRYAADPQALAYVRAHATLSGGVQDPVVALSNAYDDILPARNNGIYPDLVTSMGRSHYLVQLPPVGRGHCNFENDQIGAAFDTLTNWVESGQRP